MSRPPRIFVRHRVALPRSRSLRYQWPVSSIATIRASAVPAVKRALYYSGALDAYHRTRNRDRLTVIMFHRVLAASDPRWRTADPEYSLRDDLFAACLAFFKRHYHVVALDDVLAARAGGAPLPPRPLLITFDDGWSDNEEFALAHLRRAGLPAVLFVVADVIGRPEPFFQERLVGAWRGGRLDAERAARLWRDAGGDAAGTPPLASAGRDDLEPLRAVISQLERLDVAARTSLLAELAPVLDDGVRYMVSADQLRNLAGHFVAIGAHGKTHTPMTRAADLDAELSGARTVIAERLGGRPAPPATLSFPHGAHDPSIVTRAHAAGYQLLFTSVPELPPAAGSGPAVLGRVGFTGETITDGRGRFAPELRALHLFRKPHAA
jgi:peptidoglycan/xylan/chitin deacetylase (PgdA/CDA1 family)